MLLTSHDVWFSPIIFAAGFVLVLRAMPRGIAYWLVRSDERRNGDSESDWLRIIAAGFVLAGSAAGSYFLFQWWSVHQSEDPSVLAVLILSSLCISMSIALLTMFDLDALRDDRPRAPEADAEAQFGRGVMPEVFIRSG